MFKRLLIAAPFAAAVVAALFWVMGEFVPEYRVPRLEHIIIEERISATNTEPDIPETVIYDHFWPPPPPPPKLIPSDLPKPQGRMARERFPPPELDRRLHRRLLAPNDPCGQWSARRHSVWPRDARPGDYAVVEFLIGADGVPRDAEIIKSSNPKIHSDVIREVLHWRYRCADDPLAEKEPRRKRVRIEFAKGEQLR